MENKTAMNPEYKVSVWSCCWLTEELKPLGLVEKSLLCHVKSETLQKNKETKNDTLSGATHYFKFLNCLF